MTSASRKINPLDETKLSDIEARKHLAKMLLQLFALWHLDTTSQLNLLGLSQSSRAMLTKYKNGIQPLPNNRDTLDRAGWLLTIHKTLRLLYPRNEDIRYTWIKRRNSNFNNHFPLEIMMDEGIIGLAKVARYLDYRCGR